MSITFVGQHSVSLVLGLSLRCAPAILLAGLVVAVGPYSDREWHEEHVLQTVGSVDWFSHEVIDEARFSPDDGLLLSLGLHVPERQVPESGCAGEWAHVEPSWGIPRLDRIGDFRLTAATTRCLVADGSELICLRDGDSAGHPGAGGRERWRVASDLDLLFESGHLAGWILGNPDCYLAAASGGSRKSPPDVRLALALKGYLSLVNADSIGELLDGSSAARTALVDLLKSIPPGDGNIAGRSVLSGQIRETLAEWYP